MPTYKLQRSTVHRYSGMNINSDTSVFDFDEEDPKPSHSLGSRHLFKAAFNHKNIPYGKQLKHGKSLGINSRKKRKTSMKRLMKQTSQVNVPVQEANGNCSSSASDVIEADDSDSESNQDRMQLDMRFGGACGGSCFNVRRDEDHIADESRKVVIEGEALFFLEQGYNSPEFTFTADAIILKIQNSGAGCVATWPLHEIEEFRSYSDQKKGLTFIELDLSERGVETFLRQLGQSDGCETYYSCYTLASLITNTSSSWGEDIKQITSLSDGYRSIWRPGKEDMSERFQRNACRQDLKNHESQDLLVDCSVQNKNIASLDDWSDLIFPTKEDHDAVMVTKYDYLLLNPDEFLSDTIIDFYIKYIQSLLSEDANKRFYFYNSFFFRKLTEMDKNFQHGFEKSKASFERVKRWTARFNIFDKDYLFIPIMQSAHWSLVIVCHPGYLSAGSQDACDSKAATILHFDSLDGCHTCVEEPIRNYLVQAWNERNGHNEDSVGLSAVKFVAVTVPQQTNYSDCGLFLLHYVELFVKEVLEKDSIDFVTDKWFNPADASGKRAKIQSLIKTLNDNKESAGKLQRSQHSTLSVVEISDCSCLAQRSVSIGDEDLNAVIKEGNFFPGNFYDQACSLPVCHPQHHENNVQLCTYSKLRHCHSVLVHDHEQRSAVARELQECFCHGQEQAPCGEFSMLSVFHQGALNHVQDISMPNCTSSEDNCIVHGHDGVSLNRRVTRSASKKQM